jgi:hypothetical protein
MFCMSSPTNPYWVHLVGYGPFSSCVIQRMPVPSSGVMMVSHECVDIHLFTYHSKLTQQTAATEVMHANRQSPF